MGGGAKEKGLEDGFAGGLGEGWGGPVGWSDF